MTSRPRRVCATRTALGYSVITGAILSVHPARDGRTTQGRHLDTTLGQRLQDAIRAAEIAPREARHLQDRQGLCARLQNGPREVRRRRECVRLTNRPSFVLTPPEGRESTNSFRQAR